MRRRLFYYPASSLLLMCMVRNSRSLSSADDGRRNHKILKNQGRYRRIEHLQQSLVSQAHLHSNQQTELANLISLGDPYDAGLFVTDHMLFKQSHNQAFCDLMVHTDGPLVYLDGADGGTTRALLDSGIQPEHLYIANEWDDTVSALKKKFENVNVYYGKLQDMDTRDIPFGGAYLDGCGGATQPIMDMVDNILKGKIAPRFVIGFTITNAEPTGRPLIDRIQEITRYICCLGKSRGYHSMHHVGDDPQRFGVDPNLQRQHQTTTTCWLVLSGPLFNLDKSPGRVV